jgi:hypothetical protein
MTGFALMGLSKRDVLYEQVFLGARGMVRGLVLDRDASWLLFPPYIGIRIAAYAYVYLAIMRSRLFGGSEAAAG